MKAFIVSNNIKRRHLNAGQRAMAVAMMYPEGTPGKKTETSLAELPLQIEDGCDLSATK